MFSLIPTFISPNISYICAPPPYILPSDIGQNFYLSKNASSTNPQIIFISRISTETLNFGNLHQEINYDQAQFEPCEKNFFPQNLRQNQPLNIYNSRIQGPLPTNQNQINQNDDMNFFSHLRSSENATNPQKKRPINKKKSQTKNLIKNSGRAILTFIIKNSDLRQKVLRHLGIKESQFLESVYSFRSHIHTISAIRYLWQNHPFCKAFRILSCQYLRKHNLKHVFNSRVFKHGIYLKYQQKLMKSLQRPQEFESIKQQ